MKLVISILYAFGCCILSAQEVSDSLFYLNGNVETVNISKNLSESIECTYPNETLLSVINKSELWKIRFKSGRIEICNKKEGISSPDRTDTLFFRNGATVAVNMIRSGGDMIEYSFPGENSINSVYKTQLLKIGYASGRIENCSELLKVKVITDVSQYEDVIITYNEDDTKGLEKVAELSKASGWGGKLAAGAGYNNAIKRLQKEAAKIGCGLVLIHGSPNMINAQYGSGVRVNASAYRIPLQNTEGNSEATEWVGLSELTDVFATGEINEKSDFESSQLAEKLCWEILNDIDNSDLDKAGGKLAVIEDWYVRHGSDDKVISNYIHKIKMILNK